MCKALEDIRAEARREGMREGMREIALCMYKDVGCDVEFIAQCIT